MIKNTLKRKKKTFKKKGNKVIFWQQGGDPKQSVNKTKYFILILIIKILIKDIYTYKTINITLKYN